MRHQQPLTFCHDPHAIGDMRVGVHQNGCVILGKQFQYSLVVCDIGCLPRMQRRLIDLDQYSLFRCSCY